MVAHYKLILAYDGKAFFGMQRQAEVRTVQQEVENALTQLGWSEASIKVAGRTDAGVHASGQVVSFALDWFHPITDLQNALNAILPTDISVKHIAPVKPHFHPRYDAIARRYQYRIYCQPHRDPLREALAWRVWPELELDRMQIAASQLVGSHDFAAFGTPPKAGGSTVRQVFAANWSQQKDEFLFEVEANGFLYHMVRRMVRLFVDIGHQQADENNIKTVLQYPENGMIQGLAPPEGLTLVEVKYP